MKKLLLSTVAIVGFSAGAMAADLPRRVMAPAPFIAAPIFTWTGFYVGVNVGAAWNRNDNDSHWNWFDSGPSNLVARADNGVFVPLSRVNAPGVVPWGWDRDDDDISILGGVQVGFNWQMTPGAGFVIGVEADIQAIGNRRDRNDWWGGFGGFNNNNNTILVTQPAGFPPVVAAPPPGFGNVALFDNRHALGTSGGGDWFGTARVRLGWAFDRFLVYATGGLAFRDADDDDRNLFGVGPVIPGGFCAPNRVCAVPAGFGGWRRGDSENWGWALGVGAEWAFTNNISIGAEYLHVAFDEGKTTWVGGGQDVVGVTNLGAPVTGTNTGFFGGRGGNGDIDLVRLKVNFRFGS